MLAVRPDLTRCALCSDARAARFISVWAIDISLITASIVVIKQWMPTRTVTSRYIRQQFFGLNYTAQQRWIAELRENVTEWRHKLRTKFWFPYSLGADITHFFQKTRVSSGCCQTNDTRCNRGSTRLPFTAHRTQRCGSVCMCLWKAVGKLFSFSSISSRSAAPLHCFKLITLISNGSKPQAVLFVVVYNGSAAAKAWHCFVVAHLCRCKELIWFQLSPNGPTLCGHTKHS